MTWVYSKILHLHKNSHHRDKWHENLSKLNKLSWSQWFEMPLHLLWCLCNVINEMHSYILSMFVYFLFIFPFTCSWYIRFRVKYMLNRYGHFTVVFPKELFIDCADMAWKGPFTARYDRAPCSHEYLIIVSGLERSVHGWVISFMFVHVM